MKITNANLIRFLDSLKKYDHVRLPQKISFAITKNLIVLSNEYAAYEQQLRKIFDSYSESIEKDEHGNYIQDKNGVPYIDDFNVRNEFIKEINELLNVEIEISLHHVDDSVFDYNDDTDRYDVLTANDIFVLESILCKKE